MKTIKWILLVAFLGLIFAPLAAAETITVSDVIPFTPTDWILPACVEKFDPSLGTLTKVTIEMETCGFEDYELDSEDSSAQVFIKDLTGWTDTTLPNGDIEHIELAPQHYELSVEADDEPGLPADFAGDDWDGFHAEDCGSKVITYTDAANLALFTGAGEEACFSTEAKARNVRTGSANVEEKVDAEIMQTVTVTYEYQPPLFCIRGSKIDDCTGDGLPDWTIDLKDATGAEIKTTTTGPDGSYEFCELEPGEYTVCEVLKAGWMNIGDICIPVTLEDADVNDVDFTNTPLFCIEGHKFNSVTGEGLSGWTIKLKDASGAEIKTTTTGTGGLYRFCDLVPGEYTVCEVMKSGWKNIGDICLPVVLDCEDSTDNNFYNELIKIPCAGCPWFIKNDLYKAQCGVLLEVPAEKGILANDPQAIAVIDPESITIDPKYGTLTVEEDGSFIYDPSLGITSGTYVIFKYGANNGLCDAKYLGIAKIQVACSR
ncbi:MAG: choice-of-anchor E domain-containing protein [Methanothrix sp.]|nr:choice-of-anchor E domain-containing protein [Methanothrix sp.]